MPAGGATSLPAKLEEREVEAATVSYRALAEPLAWAVMMVMRRITAGVGSGVLREPQALEGGEVLRESGTGRRRENARAI